LIAHVIVNDSLIRPWQRYPYAPPPTRDAPRVTGRLRRIQTGQAPGASQRRAAMADPTPQKTQPKPTPDQEREPQPKPVLFTDWAML